MPGVSHADLVRVAAERGREDGAFLVAAEAIRRYSEYGFHSALEFLTRLYHSEAEVRGFVKERQP